MKKTILTLAAALMLPFAFVSCSNDSKDEDVAITGITIMSESKNVEVDSTITLKATILPLNATNLVMWASSDVSKATVQSAGTTCIVKGIAEGTVQIIAASGNISDSLTIRVGKNKEKASGIDYTSYPLDYSIHVRNNTPNKLVAFKGKPSEKQLIGGIPASGDHYLKKDSTLFNTTTDFMLFVVTESDYNQYYASSPETLDASPFTVLYAFYNTAITNEQIYEISGKMGGDWSILMNNPTGYNVELRNLGTSGEIIGYSGAGTYDKTFHVSSGNYMIFPVFRKYDKNLGEIISTYPTYASGEHEGEAKSYEFSLDEETKSVAFNVKEWIKGIHFNPSATYILILNSTSDNGMKFYKGAFDTPVVTSTGGTNINPGKKLLYAINMEKLTTNKYQEEISIAGLRVQTNRGDKAYLAGDADTQVTYKAGYMYTYTITGNAESGYTATPATVKDSEGNTVLKAEEIDWSAISAN